MHPASLPEVRAYRRRRRIVVVLLLLAAAAAGLEAYSRWPSDVSPQPVTVRPATRELILLFHGSFGRDEPTLVALEQRFLELAAGRPDVQVIRYDWSPWSDNILRAGPRGVRVGEVLGRELSAAGHVTRLHLIAHSAGAYILDPLCQAWREGRAPTAAPATVAMTFLDPIGLRGMFERGWGARNFGRCAAEADAFINTDDRSSHRPPARARADLRRDTGWPRSRLHRGRAPLARPVLSRPSVRAGPDALAGELSS